MFEGDDRKNELLKYSVRILGALKSPFATARINKQEQETLDIVSRVEMLVRLVPAGA